MYILCALRVSPPQTPVALSICADSIEDPMIYTWLTSRSPVVPIYDLNYDEKLGLDLCLDFISMDGLLCFLVGNLNGL